PVEGDGGHPVAEVVQDVVGVGHGSSSGWKGGGLAQRRVSTDGVKATAAARGRATTVSRAPVSPICALRPPTVAAPRLPPMRKTRVIRPRAPPRVWTGTESATRVVIAGCPSPK